MPRLKKSQSAEDLLQQRLLAESDLEEFIKIVHPRRLLGNIHREVIRWWTRPEAKSHQLLLLPRDHMKSALVAYRTAWRLTKDPTLKILYISSTSNLATKQLKFIKDILTSANYRLLWPEMVEREEAKREKWTEREISVDHPLRKEWSIREPSIFTAGLTSNIVGLHSDIQVLDDVVVQSNAYTEEGREKVKDQFGYLSSIAGTKAETWVVGTRYHPHDLYSEMINLKLETYNKELEEFVKEPLYEVMERQVESLGNGLGEFLWPRQAGPDGKEFGFNEEILAEKKSNYLNKVHFRAQYYNDPHDVGSSVFQRNQFQYYDANWLSQRDGYWYFKGERLRVFASIDFAFSVKKTSDFSAIVVLGVDSRNNYYILDIDRFKTDTPSEYFKRVLKAYQKWGFRKIRAEVSVAQAVLVKDLKENYIRPLGLSLVVDEFRPSRWQGSKDERIMAVLEPKYANRQVWHYLGGHCQILEEELIFANPAHDDIKDALASVIDFAIEQGTGSHIFATQTLRENKFVYHNRFGGVQ